jgi:uncharacterized coiled-coil DUF342 family protein
MNELLNRVQAIARATGNKDDHQIVTEGEEVDEFTLLKRQINLDIRELRNAIRDRDEYANSRGAKEDKAEIVRQSTVIRTRLQEIRGNAQRMRDMVAKEEDKLKSKNKSAEGLGNRYKMCDLVDAHIEECDRWFKGLQFASVKDDPSKRLLMKGSNFQEVQTVQTVDFQPQDATQSELAEIDGIEEWRMQIQENEQKIDQQLDQVLEGTLQIKKLATVLGQEYQELGIMIDEVDHQMDKSQQNLDSANAQITDLKKKLATKQNCCIDVTLFLLILAIVGYLIWKYAM